MLGRLAPQNQAEKVAVQAAGLDTSQILHCDELVNSNEIFMAITGITDGTLLPGVRYRRNQAETNSIILRAETSTRRLIHAEHLIRATGRK